MSLHCMQIIIIELAYFAVAAAAAVTCKPVCWQLDTCMQQIHGSNIPGDCKCINAWLLFKRTKNSHDVLDAWVRLHEPRYGVQGQSPWWGGQGGEAPGEVRSGAEDFSPRSAPYQISSIEHTHSSYLSKYEPLNRSGC